MLPRKLPPVFRQSEPCPSLWEPNSPDSLLDLVARKCVYEYTYLWITADPSGNMKVRDELYIPVEIAEKFIQIAQENGHVPSRFFGLFTPSVTKLRKARIEDSKISDSHLKVLIEHNLKEISIHNCDMLTVNTLHSINKHSDQLLSLNINSKHVLPDYLQPQGTFSDSEDEDDRDGNIYEKQGYIIRAPKLQRLYIRNLFINVGSNFFDLLLKPFPGLTHLDLSGALHNQGLKSVNWLELCPRLQFLSLHNVRGFGRDKSMDSALAVVTKLTELRHLDISQSEDPRCEYKDPETFLRSLVDSLPHLSSLDISGTNLAGPKKNVSDGIPGLESRKSRPFDFLGLYKTYEDAWQREGIPAKVICGEKDDAQIVEAGRRYINRPSVMEDIMNDLFHFIRFEYIHDLKGALEILLQAMERHLNHKHIQISGSASLYYVVKSEHLKRDLNVKVKRKILSTLLNGMLRHQGDPTMMRNGCLTLCQFHIPQDVLFDYKRLVQILLHSVSAHTVDPPNNFIQRAGIFLLNSIACQVDGEKKMLVGNLGAIESMLNIIQEKLNAQNCDDVMETAWSTMWNITDETPANCERFLKGDGMKLFLQCKEKFYDKEDLLRNMMGLLGNVSEVPELRSKLMTREFVEEFSFLLDSSSDGIEVSYNAAGVLAHLASDGEESWTIESPDRERVLARMLRAIKKWRIESKRNINYRSFEPIMRLLSVDHTPECQLWAIWALANLTSVIPEKYCRLVLDEGGLNLIMDLINKYDPNSNHKVLVRQDVCALAHVVRSNLSHWEEKEKAGWRPEEHLEYDG